MASSSILAKIGLNSAGFKTGLAQCRMAASSFKKSVGGMFSGLGSQILGAFGLSAGVAGLGMLTRKAIETGSQISDMASHLRIGTTELQVLQSVARDAGVDMSKFEMALNNLNLRTAEACDGNDKYREAFERLGIDLKNFASLPMEQKLAAIANGYKKSGESLSSLSDISTLLGQKAGPQLLEVLDRISTEGMESLTESAIKAGNVMDEETIATLDRASDEIGRWQNKVIVAFGGFLSDMGSAIGRQKWGLMIGMKLAQAGEFIEETLRNISNYILAVFSSIFRYLNGLFADFIVPIRNIFFSFIESVGGALSRFISLFSEDWSNAIDNAIEGMRRLKDEANKLAQKDKGKSFGQILSEEKHNAAQNNANRKRSDLWSSKSVDWYKDQLKYVEAARDAEKQAVIAADKLRKSKYQKADAEVEIKKSSKDKRAEKSQSIYNDSSLAKIGGGGLTAARYDVSAHQLSEAKKQSKLLQKIAENTEKKTVSTEILMK